MSPLRQQMIRVLELHRKSPDTIKPYVTAVAQLAQYYQRSPDQISDDEIRGFLHHLITVRKITGEDENAVTIKKLWLEAKKRLAAELVRKGFKFLDTEE